MLSWLRSLFRRQEPVDPGQSDSAQEPLDSAASDLLSRMLEAEDKAWWKGKTSAVADTDEQLAVIGPRVDATADELRSLGEKLKLWQETHSYARHIWGLDDLLEGQCPQTPPIYLMVPYPTDRFAECYEPVALAFVARGTDQKQATESLTRALGEPGRGPAFVTDPKTYSDWNR